MAETILLVDDEEGIRNVLGIALEDSGYHVLKATSGEEALSIFRSNNPTIVLTDIKMPGMDGLELLQKIKEESPETEVVMITGHGDMELAVKSLQCEAADFITKPIHNDALEISLKRVHERMDLKKQLKAYTESLEHIVQEKTQELLRAERMAAIGQTVATIAHSIKNIIGGLKGGVFVLEKGIELANTSYLNEGWRMIRGNVDKIRNLSLDLLNYAGERKPDYIVCNPNDPLQEIYELVLAKAQDSGISLKIETCGDLSAMPLDVEGIHCCLLNLAGNALDACSDLDCTRGTKEVVLRSCRTGNWGVEYQVSDNGCGMDEETVGKIFRGFYSTKGTKGTGLGLMITQKIINQHGGTIDVTSRKGKGTTFIIRLPRILKQSPSNVSGVVQDEIVRLEWI
jgi:signal transduction histidine kinase